MTWKHSCHKTRYTSSKWILWVHEILKNTQFIELRNYLSKLMGEAQLSLCRLVNSTEHFTTRVVHTTDSTYLQIMCFKRCNWISYSELQTIIKQSLSLNFWLFVMRSAKGSWGVEWTKNPWLVKVIRPLHVSTIHVVDTSWWDSTEP